MEAEQGSVMLVFGWDLKDWIVSFYSRVVASLLDLFCGSWQLW